MKWLIMLALAALAACGTTMPVELEAANAVQRQAAEALERDYQKLVDASTAEIARMGMVILDAEIAKRWETAATPERMISIEAAQGIADWAAGERQKILDAQEAKRAQLATSPNLEVLKDMNQALRDYLVSVGGAVREIERLLGAANGGQSK